MKITELYIKNFGRFSEQHFYIKDGVQVIYGENEYGKSTLQAFIRAMLFGMERGRGKAAAKDDFSKYQPWENPNYYAGVMRFRCGNRNFRLERSFDRISKQVSLVCEDDGEELSVEHGDLDILLGGITPGMYDNTVSIGQFQSRPGQELAESLKNYAANYYETGGGELDLSGAISDLRERKKAVEQQCRFAREQREKKYLSMEQECTYLEKDMRKFQAQYEENQQRIRLLQQRQKENDSKETDLFASMLGFDDKIDADEMNGILLKSLNDVNQGKSPDFTELDIDKNVEFYIVGIAPNVSRLAQKFIYLSLIHI